MVGPLWYAPVHGRRAAGRTGRLAGEAAAGEAPDAGPSPAGSTAAARRSPPAGEGVDRKPGSLGGEAAAGEAPDAGRFPAGSTAAARRSPPAGEGADGKLAAASSCPHRSACRGSLLHARGRDSVTVLKSSARDRKAENADGHLSKTVHEVLN